MRLCNKSLEYVGGIVAYLHTLQVKSIIGIHLQSCFVPPDGCQFNISQSPTVSIYSFVLSRCSCTVLFLFMFSVWVDSDVSSALIILQLSGSFHQKKMKMVDQTVLSHRLVAVYWIKRNWVRLQSCTWDTAPAKHQDLWVITHAEKVSVKQKGEREWVNHWHLHFFLFFYYLQERTTPFLHAAMPFHLLSFLKSVLFVQKISWLISWTDTKSTAIIDP